MRPSAGVDFQARTPCLWAQADNAALMLDDSGEHSSRRSVRAYDRCTGIVGSQDQERVRAGSSHGLCAVLAHAHPVAETLPDELDFLAVHGDLQEVTAVQTVLRGWLALAGVIHRSPKVFGAQL